MRLTKIYRIKLLATLLVIAFFCVAIASNSGQGRRRVAQPSREPYLRDLSVDPPDVESMSVKLLERSSPEGNALLKVIFVKEERKRIGTAVPIQLERRRVILRDDGKGGDEKADDGIYSAVIDFDLQEFDRQQQRLREAQNDRERSVIPRFKGREQVAEERVEMIDVRSLKAGQEIKIFPFWPPFLINKEKSLMIRDPAVVTDPTRTFNPCTNTGNPTGKWTFGYLMTQMANQPVTGVSPSAFVRKWLAKWEANQTINGWNVPNRQAGIKSQIIDPWQAASGGPGHPLDLTKAPFKLVAIVNRVDLRTNTVYGGGSAGEARFVFGAMDQNCNPLRFTVIFEYGVPRTGCLAVKQWGQLWAALGLLPIGSPAYNAALENITEQFAKANANPSKPNRSALNQLRTNEFALGVFPWELREFQIGKLSKLLDEVTVKQTPDFSRNGTPVLTNYVNTNAALIKLDKHTVPVNFPGMIHFLGGAAPTPAGGSGGTHWNAPGIADPDARFHFSLNTCNGCHGGETATAFLQVDPTTTPAGLAGFLTGINVPDVAAGVPVHHFDDLQRRAVDLSTLVNQQCFFQLAFEPLRMVH